MSDHGSISDSESAASSSEDEAQKVNGDTVHDRHTGRDRHVSASSSSEAESEVTGVFVTELMHYGYIYVTSYHVIPILPGFVNLKIKFYVQNRLTDVHITNSGCMDIAIYLNVSLEVSYICMHH